MPTPRSLADALASADRATTLHLEEPPEELVDLSPLRRLEELALGFPLERLPDGLFELRGLRTGSVHLEPTVLSWLPEEIHLPNLAFNLACYHARRGPRERLLAAVRHGRRLGKPAAEYLADDDFAAHRDDPEFRAALG
jgi:hypothetical protein